MQPCVKDHSETKAELQKLEEEVRDLQIFGILVPCPRKAVGITFRLPLQF